MKTKTIVVSGLLIVGLAVAGWVMFNQSPSKETLRANTEPVVTPEMAKNPTPPVVAPVVNPDSAPTEQASSTSESAPPSQSAKTDASQNVAPQSTPAKKQKEPLQDPDARAALSLVGADAEAEKYWVAAINDSSLPTHERQDLIEDLNEEGFDDPKNLTLADLPLIVSRLQLIEDLAPDAMDKVNADAFAEAYKDLANMFAGLTQR